MTLLETAIVNLLQSADLALGVVRLEQRLCTTINLFNLQKTAGSNTATALHEQAGGVTA